VTRVAGRGVRHWPKAERPREKMLSGSAGALSNAELVAILLGAGSDGASAVEIASQLLSELGGLSGLSRAAAPILMRRRGVGEAKAVQLLAGLELGRRACSASLEDHPVVRGPEDVAALMVPRLRDLLQEEFHLLCLNSRNGVIREITITRGTLDASLVHPREVFRVAIESAAAALIVVHNHPSGNPEPSEEDLAITRQLVEAGKIIGIPVRDHLVIAGNHHTSMAQRGFIDR
jgi:DNA repair protein RadC